MYVRFTSQGALVLLAAALLAGCGAPSQTSPAGLGAASNAYAFQPISLADIEKSRRSPIETLKLEIAGRIPSPLPREVLQRILTQIESGHRPHVHLDGTGKVGLWAIEGFNNLIFGQNAKGDKTVTVINTLNNGCNEPFGSKVDHAENLWTACGSYDSGNGAIQEYEPGSNTPAATFTEPENCGSGCTREANLLDVAIDTNGHVFGANPGSEICNPSCETSGLLVWWNSNDPNSPTDINDPDLTNADYIDVDTKGNLYVEGFGCIGSDCGALLDEIGNATSKSPAITNLIPPSSGATDGLYISNDGKVLNLIDGSTRTIAQYALPWISGEAAFNTLGPTENNYFNDGYPINGGFGLKDKLMALGDAGGWIDIGKVSKNRWSMGGNVNLYPGLVDAAYVPSDK